jgi:prevent-host-death family protein
MIRIYNIHEAKTHLSRLLQQVQHGDEVLIARAGKTIAKLVPAREPPKQPRRLGTARGQIWIAPDFNAPDPEIEDLFNNGPIYPDEKPATRGKPSR